MRSRFPALALLFTASLFYVAPARAFASDPLPKADEVLKKVIERAKWEKSTKLDDQWASSQHAISEKLNKDGAVEEKTERLTQPVLIQGKVYSRVISKNGKALTADDQEKEAEREKKFREAIAKKQKDPESDDDADDVDLDENLVARYNFAVIKQELVGNRQAFMLTFLPRPGVKLPEKKKMDKVLNRLEGRVWIDTETYALVKVDMHLTEPTTMMGGLGSVRSLDFMIELAQIAPNVFAPKEVNVSFEGRQLFKSMRVKQKGYFTDYRKITELAEAK